MCPLCLLCARAPPGMGAVPLHPLDAGLHRTPSPSPSTRLDAAALRVPCLAVLAPHHRTFPALPHSALLAQPCLLSPPGPPPVLMLQAIGSSAQLEVVEGALHALNGKEEEGADAIARFTSSLAA